MKLNNFLGIAALCLIFTSCSKDEANPSSGIGSMQVEFDNVVGKEDLQMNTKSYINSNGESFKVSTLRYFVSNFKLKTADGKEFSVPQDSCYFLIDETDKNSQTIKLKNVPEGDYSQISFVLGVDSLRNTMEVGKRAGNLDIGGKATGMYWSWNSGYIFFKMEGESPQAPLDNAGKNMFRYHIGGFGGLTSKTINNVKTITLAISGSAKVRTNNTPMLHLLADISKVFSGKNTVKIAQNSTVMFNEFSTKIAENYTNIFTVDHVH